MNKPDKNYSRLSNPERPRTKRGKATAMPYGRGAIYRSDRTNSNFRMVAIAIMMLFAFCVLLFAWNIVLWREVVRLQREFTSFQQENAGKSPSPLPGNCEVTDASSEAMHGSAQEKKHQQGQEEEKSVRRKSHVMAELLKRQKRDAAEAIDESIPGFSLNVESGLLSRIKRSGPSPENQQPTADGQKKSRRKKNKKKKGSVKGKSPIPGEKMSVKLC